MIQGPPQPGEVIQYAYLWRHEARRGQEEGLKDRPCSVVVAREETDGSTRLYVLPITHTPPRESEAGVEIPPSTKRRLGLDDERSWIITTEFNDFVWPGPDIRRVPGGNASYGLLPRGLYHQVMEQVRAHARGRQFRRVEREEAP